MTSEKIHPLKHVALAWAAPLGWACTAWALAVFFAAPSIHYFEPAKIFSMRSGDYLHQCAHPLTRALGTPLMAYRIFVPLVAWLIGARLWLALALPYFATIAMLAVVCRAVSERDGRAAGIIATMLVSSSYAVTWPDCMLGYPDGVAHLCAACLLLARRPWVQAGLVLAGLFTDERFILELPLVLLWHDGIGAGQMLGPWTRSTWRPVLAAFAAWLVLRHALTVGWIGPGIPAIETYEHMPSTLAGLRPVLLGWEDWWLNVVEAFRWTWLLLAAAFAFRWAGGRRLEVACLGAILAASVFSTILVFDVARSVGFSFLVIPLCLHWLVQARPREMMRIGQWAVWLCYLTPSVWIVPGLVIWWRPLVLRIYAMVTGHDPMDWQHLVY
jgi:hypothetical protein